MNTGLVLEKAVQGMCARLAEIPIPQIILSESSLWNRLVECILSSQVSFASAQAASRHITSILFSPFDECEDMLTDTLTNCLLEPIAFGGKRRRYRFPRLKSRQVARTWLCFEAGRKSLAGLIYSDLSENELRNELVKAVSGMGLKQASMFLRDVGVAKNLAIIDRHVLNYMEAVHLGSNLPKSPNRREYLDFESNLQQYAAFLGYPLNILDRAVWLVTRTAKQERML